MSHSLIDYSSSESESDDSTVLSDRRIKRRREESSDDEYSSEEESQSSRDLTKDARRLIKDINKSCKNEAKKSRDDTAAILRNQCNTIMVKVDGVIYHLNRIQLALKSDYFEKLLTADFNEKNSHMVEICSIDNHVFPSIVELINGADLESVINTENYVELLMAMDYLQMEIDLKIVHHLIISNLKVPLGKNLSFFVFYHFIKLNRNFKYLWPIARGYLSIHLIEFYDLKEFLSLTAKQFVKIIKTIQFSQYARERNKIGKICAKWICHDVENRLPRIVALVNAVRHRYNFSHKVSPQITINVPISSLGYNPDTKQAMIEEYFDNLFSSYGEIDWRNFTYQGTYNFSAL